MILCNDCYLNVIIFAKHIKVNIKSIIDLEQRDAQSKQRYYGNTRIVY
jgi:hypothetical protein